MGKEQEAGSATGSGGARIVVVGGGVAGLEIATALGKGRADAIGSVTLVDSDSAHVWKPMLHTIAAGTRDLAQQQTTYLAQASDASFAYQPGEMCGLDREAREVLLAPIEAPDGREIVPGRRIAYDRLVIAVGSGANDFGTPGVDEHCFMIDSRRKADAFNSEIRLRMVRCMTSGEQLRVAIVGGGATGVELLLSLAVKWAQESGVPLSRALAAITASPVQVLGSALGELQEQLGRLAEGGVADLCIVDPQAAWTVKPQELASQGKSTPFGGYELPARVRCTLVDGRVAFERR